MKQERKLYLDIAKGIGILLIVLGHQNYFSYDGRLCTLVYSFHLPLFILLGGYWIDGKKDGTAGEFAVKKFDRLVRPYFLFAIVSLLLSWPEGYAPLHIGIAKIFQGNIAGSDSVNTPLWFMPMFFLANLAFYGIHRISLAAEKKAGKKVFGLEEILCLAAAVLGFWLLKHVKRLPWSIELALISQIFFLAGAYFRRAELWLQMQDKKKAFAFQAGGALAAALIWLLGVLKNGRVDMNAAVFGNVFLFYLTALAGIYLTFIVSRILAKAPVIKGFLALCGRCSLYIMGYHIYAPIVMNIVVIEYMPLLIRENYIQKNIIGIGYQVLGAVLVGIFLAALHSGGRILAGGRKTAEKCNGNQVETLKEK